jgi:hypothetical protein
MQDCIKKRERETTKQGASHAANKHLKYPHTKKSEQFDHQNCKTEHVQGCSKIPTMGVAVALLELPCKSNIYT